MGMALSYLVQAVRLIVRVAEAGILALIRTTRWLWNRAARS